MKSFKFHDVTFVKLCSDFNDKHYKYYHQFIPKEVLYFISNGNLDIEHPSHEIFSYGIVAKITLLKRNDSKTFAIFYFSSDLDYLLREKDIFFTKDYEKWESRLKKIKMLK
jgi:hypothetical protein